MLAQPVLSSANFHYSANLGGNSQLPTADGSNLVFYFIAGDQKIQLFVVLTFLGSLFHRRIDAQRRRQLFIQRTMHTKLTPPSISPSMRTTCTKCAKKATNIKPYQHDKERWRCFRHDNVCGRLMAASYRQREEEAIEREMGILPREKVMPKNICEIILCQDIFRHTFDEKH